MMKAEDYVVSNHLAQVISQSFGTAEDAFDGTASLENLRYAFKDAAANGVTVLALVGRRRHGERHEGAGRKGRRAHPVPDRRVARVRPARHRHRRHVSVHRSQRSSGPAADELIVPGVGAKCANSFNPGGIYTEVAWTFSGGGYSHVFAKPSYQSSLPAGSSFTGTTRGVPDVAFQASSATGALVYLSLPPDGTDLERQLGHDRLVLDRRHVALGSAVGRPRRDRRPDQRRRPRVAQPGAVQDRRGSGAVRGGLLRRRHEQHEPGRPVGPRVPVDARAGTR